MREYDRHEERTGVQESSPFRPDFDVQSDFVMVYGLNDLKKRIAPWKKAGYVIHLMTGVSWGGYQDYLFGRFDGINHRDEGQKQKDGTEISHGKDVPYMVPSNAFAHYLAEGLKKAVDCGVEAIHLEEPEFWVHGGYSDAFKREWRIFYKEDWQDPDSSEDAQYRAGKLKQYLYTRTLDRLCSEVKEYAMVKYGRDLRFYVPTHSLINYSQWQIVSPESKLIDLPTVDGYIAQVWTDTARTRNVYRGEVAERTFETAFLEYGIMQELVRGTGRRMWFLADPIADDPHHTWKDYRDNYYRTVTASLLHPAVSRYEVSPWPRRVMESEHPDEDGRMTIIPPAFKTNLLTVMHALRDMADEKEITWLTDTPEAGILMSDTAMFERHTPGGSSDDRYFSGFYGLSMPLVKAGIAARPVQLDNADRFAGYLDDYKTLILSYEFMKPAAPGLHSALVNWVRRGGNLVYVGDGSDPFHKVREWWNEGKINYAEPAEHLFETLGLTRTPADGRYAVGQGSVTVWRISPRAVAENPPLSDSYRDMVLALLNAQIRPLFILRRGAYVISANVGNEDETLKGTFINIYDENLDIVNAPVLKAGSVGLWYDVSFIDKSSSAFLIAASARAERIMAAQRSFTFTLAGPSKMTSAVRIWTKRKPKSVTADQKETAFRYDESTGTTYFEYPSEGKKVKIKIIF